MKKPQIKLHDFSVQRSARKIYLDLYVPLKQSREKHLRD